MENPKQELTEARFFEEESMRLRAVLVVAISVVAGTLAVLIGRTRNNIEKEN